MSNFIKPKVLSGTDDVTSINYLNPNNQVSNDELGIGTSTLLLLCGNLEDEVVGMVTESHFFSCMHYFYEASITKMLAKFPF